MNYFLSLVKVELKKSYLSLVITYLISLLLPVFIIVLYNTFDSPDPYHDIVLIFIFGGVPYLFRRSIFKIPNEGATKPADAMIHYNQLPIKKSEMILSQIFIFIIYHLPSYLIIVTILYVFDPQMNGFSLNEYTVLLLTLLMSSFCFGLFNLTLDFGLLIHRFVYYVIGVLVIITGVFAWGKFIDIYKQGLFLYLAEYITKHVGLSLSISAGMMVSSLIIYPIIMNIKLNKIDY